MKNAPRVVVIGGGFGGLNLAQRLGGAPVEVTLIDRRNFHLFQPLLYQVATGELSPANIAAPLRAVLRKQRNVRVLMAEVCGFDLANRGVKLTEGEIPYDYLVVAAGAENSYFGHDEWEPLAPALKTVEDATEIRRRILTAFEAAEKEVDAEKVRELLTFVVVGGGPTGVELAGALAEISNYTLRDQFRRITPSHSRIILLEAGDRLMTAYPADLSEKAKVQLEQLGVEVRSRVFVTDVQPESVTYRSGERIETIRTNPARRPDSSSSGDTRIIPNGPTLTGLRSQSHPSGADVACRPAAYPATNKRTKLVAIARLRVYDVAHTSARNLAGGGQLPAGSPNYLLRVKHLEKRPLLKPLTDFHRASCPQRVCVRLAAPCREKPPTGDERGRLGEKTMPKSCHGQWGGDWMRWSSSCPGRRIG